MEDKDFLEHFGVLGMHWGHRKAEGSVKVSSSRKKKIHSEDEVTKRVLKRKKPHQMSNSEIKQLSERLQLEGSLKRLSPNAIGKGKKYVKGFLETTAMVAAVYTLSTTPVGQAAIKAVRTAVNMNAAKWVL